ncbi:MAG: DUF4242 domain-containing protein [bacterium]
MKRYVIERDLPGAGSLTAEQLRDASQISNGVIRDLGVGIQWVQSFVTADRIYCVYLAESEQLVREHAKRAGLPASSVSEVMQVIDPLTAMPQRV